MTKQIYIFCCVSFLGEGWSRLSDYPLQRIKSKKKKKNNLGHVIMRFFLQRIQI